MRGNKEFRFTVNRYFSQSRSCDWSRRWCVSVCVCFNPPLCPQRWRFTALPSPSRRSRRARVRTPASPAAISRASATPAESSAFMPGGSSHLYKRPTVPERITAAFRLLY